MAPIQGFGDRRSALWELAPRVGLVRSQSVPPFSRVASEAVDVLGRPEFLDAPWCHRVALLRGARAGDGRRRAARLADGSQPVGSRARRPVARGCLPGPEGLPFVLWWGAGEASRIAIVVVG